MLKKHLGALRHRKEKLIREWMIWRTFHICKSLGQLWGAQSSLQGDEAGLGAPGEWANVLLGSFSLWRTGRPSMYTPALSLWLPVGCPAPLVECPLPVSCLACELHDPGGISTFIRLTLGLESRYGSLGSLPRILWRNWRYRFSFEKEESNKKPCVDWSFVYKLGILISSE
jgi:hypothetical protein